jgi:hypothetical protein
MEPAKLETSIGVARLDIEGRDRFTLKSAHEYGEAWPHFRWLLPERGGERWEFDKPPEYKPDEECSTEIPMPADLADELLALGNEWANAHPEAFETAAREEFDDLIGYITQDVFDELARIFTDAQKNFREILDEPEFANYASTKLRRRVQKEAQRLRTMRLQVSGAANAINTLAGRRPSEAENQTAAQ